MSEEAVAPTREPVVHPKPTATVVKELYGTAFRCGKPDCRRPLYRVTDEGGEMVLNSQVAHIHARSEGGPRWKEGMSAEENRSVSNLIPLCLEHALEIDRTPDLYPADLLRQWKVLQLAECRELQKSWTLNDDEVDQVRSASFDARYNGYESASAQTVMNVMGEVGTFLEVARAERRLPEAVAREWQRRRAEANASFFAYNSDGNRLSVELSRAETLELRRRMEEALGEVGRHLETRVATIKGMAHALSVDSALSKWCDWLRSAVDAVLDASIRWPAALEDDDVLGETLESLHRASIALGKAARGEPGDEPPPATADVAPPPEADDARQWRLHRELMEAARPWARVKSRSFDLAVYSSLVDAATYALRLPPVPSLRGVDLDATARLASQVARNAPEDTLRALVDQAGLAVPVAIASALLRNLAQIAEETSRDSLRDLADGLHRDRLHRETWDAERVWRDNGVYCREVLSWTAHVLGTDHVRRQLAIALEVDPSLARAVVAGIAQFGDSHDFESFSWLGVRCAIREVPDWVPTEPLAIAIRSAMPDVVARDPGDYEQLGQTDPEVLGAQFLWLIASRD